MGVRCEAIAVTALREYLLAKLPARVATINATRAPVLKSALLEPFNVTSGMSLSVSTTGVDDGYTACALTVGAARTAAQLAADIELEVPGVASADSDGRLLLTGTAPTSAVQSIAVKDDPNSGAAELLGWDPGGEKLIADPLVAPTFHGVADGLPVVPDMGPGFWVILGRRSSVPSQPDIRRDEYFVAVDVLLMHRETNVQVHRSREHIHSVVRCVRETLLTDDGRRLGRAGVGDIIKVEEKNCLIDGVPFAFRGGNDGPPPPNGLFDRAFMQLLIKVFERPDAT